MTAAPGVRKLDVAAKASINIVDLNNKVVLMRKLVRRAKLYVIHSLTRKLKLLRKKKGSEDQKKKNETRANKLVEEIKIIQLLKPDYVSKYSLGSTDKLQDLVCKPSTTIEMRALARLAENKFLQDVVKDFREKHSDWKELAAYLMTKHTSREFKRKKTKDKMSKVKVNVEATETLVKSYLSSKLGSNEDSEGNMEDEKSEKTDTGDEIKDEIGSSNDEDSDNDEDTAENKMTENSSENEDEAAKFNMGDEQEKESDNSDDSESEIVEGETDEDDMSDKSVDDEDESVEGNSSGENRMSDESENEEEEEEEDEESAFEESSSSDVESIDRTSQKGIVKKSDKSLSRKKFKSNSLEVMEEYFGKRKRTVSDTMKHKPVEIEKRSGEMIVKRLKLTEEDNNPGIKEVPEFLLGVTEGTVKTRKKRKDPFFDSGVDNEEDSDSEPKTSIKQQTKDFEKASKFDFMSDKELGMKALSTTFLGSLNSGKMMECSDPTYRTNAEWKSLREDRQSYGDFRGGGRGSLRGRGRGDFRGRGRGEFRDRGRGNFRGRGDFRGRDRGDFRGRGRGDFRGRGRGRGDFRDRDRGDFRGRGRGDFRGRGRGDFRGRGRGDFSGSNRGDIMGRGRGDFRGKGRGDLRGRDRGGQERGAGSFKGPSGPRADRGPSQMQPHKGKSNPLEKSGPVHPSWEASQKRKQQAASIHNFTGKKITFDD